MECGKRTWCNTLVDLFSGIFVTSEADNRELRLHHAGLNFSHSDLGLDEFPEQGTGESADGMLCCAVDASTDVWLSARDRSNVDDMTSVPRLHS